MKCERNVLRISFLKTYLNLLNDYLAQLKRVFFSIIMPNSIDQKKNFIQKDLGAILKFEYFKMRIVHIDIYSL